MHQFDVKAFAIRPRDTCCDIGITFASHEEAAEYVRLVNAAIDRKCDEFEIRLNTREGNVVIRPRPR